MPTGFARDRPKLEDAAAAAPGLAEEPEHDAQDDEERQQAEQESEPGVLLLAVDPEVCTRAAPDLSGDLVGVALGEAGADLAAVRQRALDHVVLVEQRDAADAVVGESLLEGDEVDRPPARALVDHAHDDEGGDHGERDAEDEEATGFGHGSGRPEEAGRSGYRGPVTDPQWVWLALRPGVLDDVGQVAVALVHVEPVADDERRREAEADVLDVELRLLQTVLHEQRADLQRRRAAGREVAGAGTRA